MKLYRLDNAIGSYWIIAPDPTAAEQKLMTILNKHDYGFFKDRTVKTIALIADAYDDTGIGALTNKFLIV